MARDPRPEISFNDLHFNLGLGYAIAEIHYLKASFGYRYNKVDNDNKFSYKDKKTPAD
ncbi:hypothetical protein HCG49_13395 [Arenibacter sp. 6A1]|uniref:DUF6850 family outer membrane beta-barrel protein n=1 Tax=Arenibacter sp. 6A1 TaxID=2720391 RepID=UPI0014454611|nr:DUF6850 family outer membrane beta-barrel protein [Arenibacter sp. 6A1]NKI27559.1 hypothetical protein [Arenibacter sp. 6A1]